MRERLSRRCASENLIFAATHRTFFFRHSRGRFRQMSEVGVGVNHYGVTLNSLFSDSWNQGFHSI